jgi:shikimate kinase
MVSGPTTQHLALVGLMGSGKSSVGRVLATRLERELIDTDALVEAATGRPVNEIFASEGEEAFRRYELNSLTRALSRSAPAVVATGGGVVITADARQALRRNATVIWLRADPSVLARRLEGDRTRPLLADRDPLARLKELHDHRAPLYEEVADAVVEADGDNPSEVAEQVLDVLGWQR